MIGWKKGGLILVEKKMPKDIIRPQVKIIGTNATDWLWKRHLKIESKIESLLKAYESDKTPESFKKVSIDAIKDALIEHSKR